MTPRSFLRLLPMVLVLALLPGCAAVSALTGGGGPLTAYELRPPADLPLATRTEAADLVVEVPEASGAIDTDAILIRPTAIEASYLPGAQWTEDAPRMLQSALVAALESTQAFRYVGRRPLGPGGDYALVWNLTRFSAEVIAGTETAEVEIMLTARLIREEDASVMARETFLASGAAADISNAAIAAAYDAAARDLLGDMTVWVLEVRGLMPG